MDSIAEWLAAMGLVEYTATFEKNDIDLSVLAHLTDSDLEKMGSSLGHRRRMLHAIASLDPAQLSAAGASPSSRGASAERAPRQNLTVLRCRLADSTALAARLGPDDMRTLKRNVQLACGSVIRTYNGFLAKLLDDGVIAFFGYPEAEEDDAERALLAALGICVGVEMLETSAGTPPTVQIGVASGEVELGASASESSVGDQALTGETPELAARLLTLAEPGGIVISSATRNLVGAAFDVRELGYYEVKGLAGKKREER